MLTKLINWLFSKQTSDDVRQAIEELEAFRHESFSATLGEPEVVKNDSKHHKESMISVPVRDAPFGSDQNLVFDVPAGRDNEDFDFIRLLKLFDLAFENMEELEGTDVPVAFIGGSLTVLWETLEGEGTTTYVNKSVQGQTEEQTEKQTEEQSDKGADKDDGGKSENGEPKSEAKDEGSQVVETKEKKISSDKKQSQ